MLFHILINLGQALGRVTHSLIKILVFQEKIMAISYNCFITCKEKMRMIDPQLLVISFNDKTSKKDLKLGMNY